MSKPQTAVIYCRISKDRNGESLAVQRQDEECRKLAELLGVEVMATFVDNDISAFTGKRRPDFETMLVFVQRDKIGMVICWHQDRLYRSLKDLMRLLDLGKEHGLQIRTVQGGDIDLATASGQMVATILGSVQVNESAHHSERRKAAYVQKAESGGFGNQGNRPFGYTRDGEPLEPEASMYRKAVKDVLAGASIRGIAKEWNATGITTTLGTQWSSTRIRRILLNPRYAGIKTHLGKEIRLGTWTALIEPDLHRGVVAYLSDPSRQKVVSFDRKYIGSGVFRCGKCGGQLAVSFPGKNQPRKYKCKDHSCVMRGGDDVDNFVENVVIERLSEPDAHLLLAAGVDVAGLQATRAALVAQFDELSSLLLDGVLDGPGVRRNSADLKAKIAAIDSQLASAATTSPTAALLATGKRLRKHWNTLSPAIRSQIIDEVAVVTVYPCPSRGVRKFDPKLVDVVFPRDGDG